MNISNDRIAALLHCPKENVAQNWPLVETCLESLGMNSDAVKIAALATIAVETGKFQPIHEFGSKDYFIKHYDGRKDLGNLHPGDGYTYRGRGYVQITGELNYQNYGKLLGIDLIDDPNDPNDDNDPEKACDPMVAACIFAAYFHDRKVDKAAEAGDWQRCRKLVNGGLNGWDKFHACVVALQKELNSCASAVTV